MNYLIFIVAVVVATAALLGLLWWYSTRPLYPEADAYAKKYCSDEQALVRASEEAWRQARESNNRAKSMLFGIPVKFDPTTPKNEIRVEAATPSPPTASPTTDSPSDAVQETTGVWTPQSWQLDPRITPGGPVGFGSEFVDPEDVLT